MQTSESKIIDIIAHRLEGDGIRKTQRLCHVHTGTITDWSYRVGLGCAILLDGVLQRLPLRLIEVDELHTYVGTKQRHLQPGAPAEQGDTWGFLAEDAISKAVVSFRLGKRDHENTSKFVEQLCRRVVGRPQVTSDGYAGYLRPFERFADLDFSQLVKEYKSAFLTNREGKRIRVADYFVEAKLTARLGSPILALASTSHVERLNATLRGRMSKFARLSAMHAKDWWYLFADLALFVADYNFCREHSSTDMTPAHALKLTDGTWSVPELVTAALDALGKFDVRKDSPPPSPWGSCPQGIATCLEGPPRRLKPKVSKWREEAEAAGIEFPEGKRCSTDLTASVAPRAKADTARIGEARADVPQSMTSAIAGSNAWIDATPTEQALAMLYDREAGASDEEIAAKFSCAPETVRNLLSLFDLVPVLQAAVDVGTLPLDEAAALAKLPPDEQMLRFAERGSAVVVDASGETEPLVGRWPVSDLLFSGAASMGMSGPP